MSRGLTELTWNDERIELLKQLWEAGLTAKAIAAEIGTTRNSVCGKAARIGLTRKATDAVTQAPSQREVPHARAKAASRPKVETPKVEPEVPETPVVLMADNVIPICQRVSLLELTDDNCHWPIGMPGEEDFCFCGNKSSAGSSYCVSHSRMAYQPAHLRHRYNRNARV